MGEKGTGSKIILDLEGFMQSLCFACSLWIFFAASIALLFGKLPSFAVIWSSLLENIHHFQLNDSTLQIILFENFHTDILSMQFN